MEAAEKAVPGWPTLGKMLMALGIVIFVGEMLYGFAQMMPWQISAHLGWAALVGVGVLRILSNLAWNHATVLMAGVGVLVLCWPLALVVAGLKLMGNAAGDRN